MGDVFRVQSKRDGNITLSAKWYGDYLDHTGKRRRVPLSTDKQSARAMLAEHVRQAERRKAGIHDEFTAAARTPIADLVTVYLADLKLRGRGERHRNDVQQLLGLIVPACGWDSPGAMTSGPLDVYLSAMKGSARTRQKHRQAVIAFGNWLVKKGHLPKNTLERSTRPEGDKTYKRRALSADELRALVEAARTRPIDDERTVRHGPNAGKAERKLKPEFVAELERRGRHNALLYRAAFYTGLRAGELGALQVGDLVLEGDKPRLFLPGSRTKNKRDANLPLTPELAEDLAAWIADEELRDKDAVFSVPHQTAAMLRRDLEAAKIPHRDTRGRVADFHALRMSLGSHMNALGEKVTNSMGMMRHGSAGLTLVTYNDEAMNDLRAAQAKLPKI